MLAKQPTFLSQGVASGDGGSVPSVNTEFIPPFLPRKQPLPSGTGEIRVALFSPQFGAKFVIKSKVVCGPCLPCRLIMLNTPSFALTTTMEKEASASPCCLLVLSVFVWISNVLTTLRTIDLCFWMDTLRLLLDSISEVFKINVIRGLEGLFSCFQNIHRVF